MQDFKTVALPFPQDSCEDPVDGFWNVIWAIQHFFAYQGFI